MNEHEDNEVKTDDPKETLNEKLDFLKNIIGI